MINEFPMTNRQTAATVRSAEGASVPASRNSVGCGGSPPLFESEAQVSRSKRSATANRPSTSRRLSCISWLFRFQAFHFAGLSRCAAVLFFLSLAPFLGAQTNAIPLNWLVITSRTGAFDANARAAVYDGDVLVKDPQMKLRCQWMKATMPLSGGRINHIVCKTNVVIDYTDQKGQTNHITSDQAVYDYNVQDSVTNETITFTGNPRLENAQMISTGDPIVWNRQTGAVDVTGEKMIIKGDLGAVPGRTNGAVKPKTGAAGMTNPSALMTD